MKNNLVLLIFLFFVSCTYAQAYDLQLSLKIGQTYYQLTDGNIHIRQKLKEQDWEMTTSLKMTMAYTVTSFDDKVYTLKAQLQSIRLDLQTDQGLLQASSEDTNTHNLVSVLYSKFKKETFTIYMYKTGAVKEVAGVETAFSNAFKDLNLAEDQKQQLLNQMNQMFGAEALKSSIEMSTNVLPEKTVAMGESWTKSISLGSIVPANINASYLLKAITANAYVLSSEARLVAVDDDTYVNINGMETKYLLTGNMASEIKVDRKTGWIQELKMEQTIGGTIHLKDNPQIPGGMVIPMEMKGSYTTRNQ